MINYIKEECKTFGEAWQVFKEHGLEDTHCSHCNQFSQARVLQKQDAIISDLYEALKLALELSHNPEVKKVLMGALAKADEK